MHRDLLEYDTLIIDEAHERSLNIDFLLGYLHRLLRRRPELKLIITSATIDPERFARHFDDAPVVEVSGRTFPVELRYQPPEEPGAGERDEGDHDEHENEEVLLRVSGGRDAPGEQEEEEVEADDAIGVLRTANEPVNHQRHTQCQDEQSDAGRALHHHGFRDRHRITSSTRRSNPSLSSRQAASTSSRNMTWT